MSSDNQHNSATRESSASPSSTRSSGPLIIAGLVVGLLILHQDNWFWTDDSLVLGFLPIGLFWHALISIGATLTWFLATKIAWPIHQGPTANESTATDRGGE